MLSHLHVDWIAIHTKAAEDLEKQAAQADRYNTPGGRALAKTCRELAAKRRRAAARESERLDALKRAQEEIAA